MPLLCSTDALNAHGVGALLHFASLVIRSFGKLASESERARELCKLALKISKGTRGMIMPANMLEDLQDNKEDHGCKSY